MRILKILLSFIVVLVLAVVALVLFLPGERIAKIAADQVKAQTGRDLVVEGDVSISFFPTLGVTTGPVSLSNAKWSDRGPMFQAESATIGVDAMSVLGGNIQIKDISLMRPDILLEVRKNGTANWDLFAASADTAEQAQDEPEPSQGGFTLDHLTVTDARLRYIERGGGNSFDVSNLSADFTWGEGAAELSATLQPTDQPLNLSATIADLNALISGEVTTVAVTASAARNSIEFEGLASLMPELSGALDMKMPNPDAFVRALGLAPSGAPAIDVAGAVTLTNDNVLSLRDGDVTVLGNAMRVEADVNLTGKPLVSANVVAGALDLAELLSSDDDEADASASTGWSKDRIDASALGLFDGTIAISASSLDTGGLQFGPSRMSVNVERARAVATLHQLSGYEGDVTGEFVMNNRSGLSVGGRLDLKQMALKGLLTDFMEVDRFTGLADAQISFLGSGRTLNAIMRSLSGEGALQVGQGTISGIDLDRLFRGEGTGGTTVFDSMAATWTINEGVMRNNDLRMDLPSLLATGKGRVGLGKQNINYTFTPQVKTQSETGFAVPVRVKGPWADPRIWPDLEAVVEQNFQEEVDALEEQATDAVADRLGVEREEGEDLGKAIEKKLEDELNKGLKNLLGGN